MNKKRLIYLRIFYLIFFNKVLRKKKNFELKIPNFFIIYRFYKLVYISQALILALRIILHLFTKFLSKISIFYLSFANFK